MTESQPAVQSEAHAPEAHAPDWPARMVDVLFYVGLAGLLLFFLSAALSDAGVNPATVAAALAAAGSLLTGIFAAAGRWSCSLRWPSPRDC